MTQIPIERTSAVGLARYAYEYIDAAVIVDEARVEGGLPSQVSYTPAYFLVIHGIELCLKSYMLYKGEDIESLSKSYGHDLKKCLDKSYELGLEDIFEMNEGDQEAFDLLIDLNKEHQMRYIQTGFKTYPLWSIVEPFAVRLHQAVAREVGFRSFEKFYPAIT